MDKERVADEFEAALDWRGKSARGLAHSRTLARILWLPCAR